MPNFEKEKPINILEPAENETKKEEWTFEGKDAWEKVRAGTRVKFRKPGQVGEETGEVVGWKHDKGDGDDDLLVQVDNTAREPKRVERRWVSAVLCSLTESAKKMSQSWNDSMAKEAKAMKQKD